MIWAAYPASRNAGDTVASRFGDSVIPIYWVIAPRRDFGQKNRARQIGGKYRGVIEIPAAIINDGGNLDDFDGKTSRISVEKGENSCDVELKDTVRENLLTFIDQARLKPFVRPESGPNVR